MSRVTVSGWIVFFGSVLLGREAAAQGVPPRERATGRELHRAATLRRVVTGRVLLPDGSPATSAQVVTSAGGRALTGADGSFALEVDVPLDAESLEVTAVANDATGSGSLAASARIVPPDLSPALLAGSLLLTGSQACFPRWLPTFGGVPGTDNSVHAFTVFDDGNGPALYAGGGFASASGVKADQIGRWDGSRWAALGSGMNAPVWALAVFDDGGGPALYAGGSFTSAGGAPANRVARWDGTSWSALGSGTNGDVKALTVFDDGTGPALYAGGDFASAGGAAASRIARWDGASWSPLASGMNNLSSVHALAAYDDGTGPALYAGGDFAFAGGVAASRIARWNGTSWSAFAGGTNRQVNALVVHDDGTGPALYAGGDFTSAGSVTANRIAKWDGTSWSPLGTGMTSSFGTPSVLALAVHDDGSGPALHAGGLFTSAGGLAASYIARWDGAAWSALASEVSERVFALATFDHGGGSELYAGGYFPTAGGAVATHVASWDGTHWSTLGDEGAVDGEVAALALFDDGTGTALYVGGNFASAGGVAASCIAKWDGSSWSALGSGTSGKVAALAVYDDGGGPSLYAGGDFTSAGGVAASRVAKWDGTSWSALGSGVNSSVFVLAVHDDGSGPALHVGGYFWQAGGAAANRIAKWDGTSWSALGSGMDDSVWALAVHDDGGGPALYAGGRFTSAGGVPANRIAKWDGSSWSALGGGMTGPYGTIVSALAVHDDGGGPALYAGGLFTSAGGVAASHVARWDGSSWTALAAGLGTGVEDLIVHDDGSGPALLAGGGFGRRVARWDGSSWSTLGLGMNGAVLALASWNDGSGPGLFAGGAFSASPAHDSYLAKWGCRPKPRAKRNRL